MRSKCYSRFAFIGNAQLSQIFESQGCVRTETVDELYNQKVRKTKQIDYRTEVTQNISQLTRDEPIYVFEKFRCQI